MMGEQAQLLSIKVDGVVGKDIDAPRDVARVVLEVATDSMNGADCEGHYLPAPHVADGVVTPRVVRIEVYEDRISSVLANVRGMEHDQISRHCEALTEGMRQAWLDGEVNRKEQARMKQRPSTEGRESALADFMHWRCPITKWTVMHEGFANTQHRDGLPTLLFCRVVDGAGNAYDLTELTQRRADFVRAAPPTPENRTRLAAEHQADVIAGAMRSVMGGAPSAEIAALRAENDALKSKLAEQGASLARIEQMLERRNDKNR